MDYDISIIIPFLNEGENLHTLSDELDNYISKLDGIKTQVIFVDDGSTDNSLEILKCHRFKSFSARIIKLSKNYGSHAALRAGILHSNADYTTFVYADLQDPLDLIMSLYNKCKGGCDIVWAERSHVEASWKEKVFSRLYADLMKKCAINTFPEKGFDVVLFNKKVKEELDQNIESNSSIFLQILTMGFRQDFISYKKGTRKAGKSKWRFSQKIKMFIDSFVAFSYVPIRLVSITGIVMAFIGFLWAVYITFRAVFVKDLSQGWPTMISVLMIGFGITNISLGVIAEYLWRTLDAARGRKTFIIDEIFELSKSEINLVNVKEYIQGIGTANSL